MNDFLEKQRSPWQSLLLLICYTFAFSIGLQLLALMIGELTNSNTQQFLSSADDNTILGGSRFFMYALLAIGTFGTFYLPSVVLQKREPYNDYFLTKTVPYNFYILAIAFLIAFAPLMALIGEWNANMTFPESLKGIENWMRIQEDASNDLIKKIVMVDHMTLLFMNLIVLAVFPAVAEEYYFRGSLMNIFQRIFNNMHVTIWVTAIIFSAIHVQFFGFVPRVLLGAFFGYMLYWTNNIWVPILGHFVNNASVTILAYYYTTQGKTFEDLQSYDSYSIFVYLGSFILTALIAVIFYKKSKSINNNGEGLD
ncbi:CPBP family intramembrane glutamic endopeptidase [Sphingobacterium bovistauri]|uniref:CPBP family intramembrane metalloprotease n=1 Tax=Sphingobacterium bovistauri TaxID=2781959 RepID=A0ABS7ZAZ7_9SPHI|nr:CPBP family intramembrane glutamic endopeptidase [Sphingobacterium bovistauri]MCA5006596.1 CPBP family intramembrane metalloprotease [Sphingobacterium bovistauri]